MEYRDSNLNKRKEIIDVLLCGIFKYNTASLPKDYLYDDNAVKFIENAFLDTL